MPVWPKSIYTFGVSLGTAATEWKLRQKRSAVPQQERVFRGLMGQLAQAGYWRSAGVESGLTYPAFQSRVVPRTAAQLAPAIERMQAGEPDVLWPGACTLFLVTPGTTNGTPNTIPVTEPLLAHYRRAAMDTLLFYTVRARHAGVFRGRHLWLGSSSVVKPLAAASASPAYAVEATGLAGLAMPAWMEKHLYEPGTAIGQIEDWSSRLDAIVARSCRLDISMLAAFPRWAMLLARMLREKCATPTRPIRHLQELWPNLECYLHSGVPVGPFYDELRELLGPKVRFHELYAANEAFIAAQDGEPAAGLRVLADAGVFLEFLPIAEFDEARLDQLGPRLLPLGGIRTGTDYAIFVTTPGGLVRYPLGDVVRFISAVPPRLVYVGRTSLRLHAFGENVQEKEVTDALVAVCQRHKWTIVNFHVAPLFAANLTGSIRGRHEWWVELNAGTVKTPRGPQLAEELDQEIQRLNPGYATKRRTAMMEPPFVRLVMPGVFQHWLQYRGRWGGQHKTPRCRSDRRVADDLAQITNFARD
ncbi:MAG: GH3 auxin-responsive promoter family protein [Opitutaceae bacterium]|nr:GH3 auxin-responsive promoter family protein [Opitutaceae bacterium]